MTGCKNGKRRWLTAALAVMLVFAAFPMRADAATAIKTLSAARSVPNGIMGIDVSKYQGEVDWSRVADDPTNVKFAICRASIGLKADDTFVDNATKAHKNGLKVGAYHFAKFTDRASMREEAEFFMSRLKKVTITYPVFLDVEGRPTNLTKAQFTTLVLEFLDMLKEQGYTTMIYSYTNFFRDHLSVSSVNHYDIWVANYLTEPAIGQKIWQFSSKGRIDGIKGDVDLDVAYGDFAVNRRMSVDRNISTAIKETINSRYKTELPADGVDMKTISKAIAIGIQKEINLQWKKQLNTDGELNEEVFGYLDQLEFSESTQGNITYLIQTKLFYKGYYKGEPSYVFDATTQEALKGFKMGNNLGSNGSMTPETMRALLNY